jgi:hypothetical protein
MSVKQKSKNLSRYFYSILSITIIWLFCTDDSIDNFAPVFYMLSGFPVFFSLFDAATYDFSRIAKEMRPNLFNKYKSKGRDGKYYLYTFYISQDNDFTKLEEGDEIRDFYFYTKKSFRFALISFFTLIPIAILTVLQIPELARQLFQIGIVFLQLAIFKLTGYWF